MHKNRIFESADFYIEVEESSIPWLKIFPQEHYKELGDMPQRARQKLFAIYDIVEAQMRNYYKPTKINMASFGNMLPQVHIHVMARFQEDSHFPNPMWGEKLREGKLQLPDAAEFYKRVALALKNY